MMWICDLCEWLRQCVRELTARGAGEGEVLAIYINFHKSQTAYAYLQHRIDVGKDSRSGNLTKSW